MRSLLLCIMHWRSRFPWSPHWNILITPASLAENPANGSSRLKPAMYLSTLLPIILWFSWFCCVVPLVAVGGVFGFCSCVVVLFLRFLVVLLFFFVGCLSFRSCI